MKTLTTINRPIKSILVLFISMALSHLLYAQLPSQSKEASFTSTEKLYDCATDQMHESLMKQDANYRNNVAANEILIRQMISSQQQKGEDVLRICAVVVHVIHLGEPVGTGTNISDAQIRSAIAALNNDFRRVGQGFNTHPNGADVNIEFSLAVRDPSGLPTSGITRDNGNGVAGYAANGIVPANELAVKAINNWPNTDYYNIWVVSKIEGSEGAGTQGYAYLPGAPNGRDGTVVLFNAFGTTGNLKAFANLNRTMTHEMGHALNLYHTFEGLSCTQVNCATQGDFCCDTPPTVSGNTCATALCAGAQVENYMDYTKEICKNVFTNDQKARMRAALLGPRASLLSSQGCIPLIPPVSNFSTINNSTCQGGSVSFTDISSMAPNVWNWSFSGGTPASSNVRNPVITYNTPGVYPVSLTASNTFGTGNTETKTGYITVFANPTAPGTVTAASCFGFADGNINLSPAGKAPYSFSWSNGLNTEDLNNLKAGNYTVTVVDANGCKVNATFIITNPAELTASYTSVNNSGNCGSCNGTATITPQGGTIPYTYLWSDGQSNATATGLCSGMYSCDVKNANGCSTTIYITVGGIASLIANVHGIPTSCDAACNGSTDLNVAGGISPYTFSWSTAASTKNISNLCAGKYTVTITDAVGCVVQNNVTISQPGNLTIVLRPNFGCDNSCNAVMTAAVSGGALPYSYLWSNGGTTNAISGLCPNTYSVTVTDANGCSKVASLTIPTSLSLSTTGITTACASSCSGSASVTASNGLAPYTYKWNDGLAQTTATATNLCASNYKVLVTDANGCFLLGDYTVLNSNPFTTNAVVTPLACHGACTAAISLTPSGGSTPYTYAWNDPAKQTTASANNLCAGIYKVTVTDKIGCKSFTTVTVNEVDSLIAGLTGTNFAVSCGGGCTGSGTLTGSGGSGPYVYSWSTGATIATISNLCVGSYTGKVTDNKGCVATTVLSINESDMNVVPTVTNELCQGSCDGGFVLSVTGGVDPLSYVWSDGGPNKSNRQNLCKGIYSVEITDGAGCKSSAMGTIAGKTISKLRVVLDTFSISCATICNGSIKALVSGGLTPYTYAWSTGATTDSIGGLCSGTYSLTVQGSDGCDTILSINLAEPSPLIVSASGTPIPCKGLCNGTAFVSVSGGEKPYAYLWDDAAAQTNPLAFNLCAEGHTVRITDNNGCVTTASYTVTEPIDALTVSLSGTSPQCSEKCEGSSTASPAGGTLPYAYLWSSGAATITAENLCPATHNLIVTDGNGCTATDNFTIVDGGTCGCVNPPVLALINATDASCGLGNGITTAVVQGGTGTAAFIYSWSNGDATAQSNNLSAGVYTLIVTDTKTCADTLEVTISNIGLVAAFSKGTANCAGCGCEEWILINATEGTPPFTYSWDNNSYTKRYQNNLCPGTYNVTVTDANGCTKVVAVSVP